MPCSQYSASPLELYILFLQDWLIFRMTTDIQFYVVDKKEKERKKRKTDRLQTSVMYGIMHDFPCTAFPFRFS